MEQVTISLLSAVFTEALYTNTGFVQKHTVDHVVVAYRDITS